MDGGSLVTTARLFNENSGPEVGRRQGISLGETSFGFGKCRGLTEDPRPRPHGPHPPPLPSVFPEIPV